MTKYTYNFAQINTFVMVVEENSFAAAARKQNISTAAISRQIAGLEKSLGVQLLKRTTRKLRLTEIGEQYFAHCKAALAELMVAQHSISGSQRSPSGTLKILSNRYFAFTKIIPLLATFMVWYPQLRVELELAERIPDFEKEKIDVLFGLPVPNEGYDDLVRKRVATTQHCLYAAPSYLKKQGTPKKPDDLRGQSVLLHTGARSQANTFIFKGNKQVVVDSTLQINDAGALLQCAINGMGIVKLRDYMAQDALRKKQLVEILADYREPAQSIYLYYQSSKYLQSKIRCFIDFYCNAI